MQTPARGAHRLAQHARPRLQARLKDRPAQATLGGELWSRHQCLQLVLYSWLTTPGIMLYY